MAVKFAKPPVHTTGSGSLSVKAEDIFHSQIGQDLIFRMTTLSYGDGCTFCPDTFHGVSIALECQEHDIFYAQGGTEDDKKYGDGRLFMRVYKKLLDNLDIGTPQENEFRAMIIACGIHEAVRLLGWRRFNYHEGKV